MARTQITGQQVNDGSIQRVDLDAVTAGSAVIKKVIQGLGISLTSTGVDAGTGDVTIAVVGIYDMHIPFSGVMANGEIIGAKTLRSFSLPIGLAGSYVTAKTAATASCVFTFKQNGTTIGTATFAASGTTATISFTSAITFAVGDLFELYGPATADTTLANISFDILGTRLS